MELENMYAALGTGYPPGSPRHIRRLSIAVH